MSSAPNEQEYCKTCKQSYPNWEAFLLHKIESKKHISCFFCGRDFRTNEGCSRHQHQYHAAEQNLKCAGCGQKFVRVGSYISHIEQEQCPVIHQSLFEARRVEKEKDIREKGIGNALLEWTPTDTSSIVTGTLEFEDNGPVGTSWDTWGDDDTSQSVDAVKNIPVLPLQKVKNSGSTSPDLLSTQPDKLNEENLAWLSQKELLLYLPDNPASLPQKPLAAMSINSSTKKEEYHLLDPNNPAFEVRKYFNPITGKYRCPWSECKKLLNHRQGLIQHLQSAAHMNAKLRCPGCLRRFQSATALVQHAESQAVKCQIRDSNEFKAAIHQITGGFVDTAGRHKDDTIRYIAPAATIEASKTTGFQEQVATASEANWTEWDNCEANREGMGETGDW